MASSTSSSTVQLYRYDLTGGMARSMGPMLIGRELEGIWHTSIVVYGSEFYFDGGVGVVREGHPGSTRFGAPYRRESLGATRKTEAEFTAWVLAQRQGGFGPMDYNLLENNCNHFSQAAARFLVGADIPADVREMIPTLLETPLGRMVRPMLEQATSAPPGTMAGVGGGPTPTTTTTTTASAAAAGGACKGLTRPAETLTEDERDDLILAATLMESNELLDDGRSAAGVQTTLTALETLRTVITNILNFPTDLKYRALSMASKTYTEKLKPLEEFGLDDLLGVAGFRKQQQGPQTRWVLADEDGSRGVLEEVLSVLDNAATNVETSAAVALSMVEHSDGGVAAQANAAAASSPSSP